ncbi:SDR family NAD(P)-dependent oxidoreductase, partial [Streptomyces sp. NPDC055144]
MELTGRTMLVTGAGRGLGRAISLAAARAGANVVGGSRTTEDLDRLGAEIAAEGGVFHGERLD